VGRATMLRCGSGDYAASGSGGYAALWMDLTNSWTEFPAVAWDLKLPDYACGVL